MEIRKKTTASEMKIQCRSRQAFDKKGELISGAVWNQVKKEATRASRLERKR